MTKKLKITTLQDAKQACFNGAVRGLSWQKWEQSKIGASCALNDGNGCHCAIGWLIPPEKYDSCVVGAHGALEAGILADPIMDWYRASSRVACADLKTFLIDMMISHDKNSTPEYMCDSFQKLGLLYNLTWPTGADPSQAPIRVDAIQTL